jgi:hypothetical protein
VDSQGKALAWSAAFGNGGQRLFVVSGIAVGITAGAYNQPQIGQTVNQLFKRIVEAFRG